MFELLVAVDDEPLRISIAGAQEKTALLRIDGQWCRPLGATPTTDIGHFDAQTALVVERFDRQWQDAPQRWIARIPREDFCRVLGQASEAKYEAQGGQ